MLTFGAMAQSQEPTEQMMREFRQTVQKRDISKHHLESNIPLSTQATKATKGSMKSLPTDRVWFPGEWEEVKAIAVAPYYNYLPAESQRTGYWMAKPFWGSGYMPEAVRALLDLYFSFGAERIWCAHAAFNDKSRRVIEKCGFRYCFTAPWICADGSQRESLYYAMEAEDFCHD